MIRPPPHPVNLARGFPDRRSPARTTMNRVSGDSPACRPTRRSPGPTSRPESGVHCEKGNCPCHGTSAGSKIAVRQY